MGKEEEAKMAAIEKQIEEKELLLLQRRLESHYSLMMNFIRTQSEPTIFFLPAKHNKETEAKLEDTRAAIKHKIASLKVQLQPLPDAGDEAEGDGKSEVAARASAAAAALEGNARKASLPEAADDDDDEASIPDKDKGTPKKEGEDRDDDKDKDDEPKQAAEAENDAKEEQEEEADEKKD